MTRIRTATLDDAEAIQQCIHSVIDQALSSKDALQLFDLAGLSKVIEDPSYGYLVYEQDGQIIGCIAYRKSAHLYHFFTHAHVQGTGIGRQLWAEILKQIRQTGQDCMTVNASLNAVALYQHWGFEKLQNEPEIYQNIQFMPMKKYLK